MESMALQYQSPKVELVEEKDHESAAAESPAVESPAVDSEPRVADSVHVTPGKGAIFRATQTHDVSIHVGDVGDGFVLPPLLRSSLTDSAPLASSRLQLEHPSEVQSIVLPILESTRQRNLLVIWPHARNGDSTCELAAIAHVRRCRAANQPARVLLVPSTVEAGEAIRQTLPDALRTSLEEEAGAHGDPIRVADYIRPRATSSDQFEVVVACTPRLWSLRFDWTTIDLLLVADVRVLTRDGTFDQLIHDPLLAACQKVVCSPLEEMADQWEGFYKRLDHPICVVVEANLAQAVAEASTTKWSPVTCAPLSVGGDSASLTSSSSSSAAAVGPTLRAGVYLSFEKVSIHLHAIDLKRETFVGAMTIAPDDEENGRETCAALTNCKYSPATHLLSMEATMPSGVGGGTKYVHFFGRLVPPANADHDKAHLSLAYWESETPDAELSETTLLHASTYRHVHNGVLMCADGLPLYRTSLDALQRHLTLHTFEMVQDGEYRGTLRLPLRDYPHSLLVDRARVTIAKGGDRVQLLSGRIVVKEFGEGTFTGDINLRTALLTLTVHASPSFACREIWPTSIIAYTGRMITVSASSKYNFWLQQVPPLSESERNYPTFGCQLDRVQLIPVAPVAGCPIASQPVTTLALICRFLDFDGLLACRQTGSRFAAATVHPLTFSHGIVTVAEPLNGLRVLGPQASLGDCASLRSALRSPVFSNFRLIRLTSAYRMFRPQYIYQLFQTLVAERHTSLYALHLRSEAPASFWMKETAAGASQSSTTSGVAAVSASSSSEECKSNSEERKTDDGSASAAVAAVSAVSSESTPIPTVLDAQATSELHALMQNPLASSMGRSLELITNDTPMSRLVPVDGRLPAELLGRPLRALEILEHRHPLRWLNASTSPCEGCKTNQVISRFGCARCRCVFCFDCFQRRGGFQLPPTTHQPLTHTQAWSLLFQAPATQFLRTLTIDMRLGALPHFFPHLPLSLENLEVRFLTGREIDLVHSESDGLHAVGPIRQYEEADVAPEKAYLDDLAKREGGPGLLLAQMVEWIRRVGSLRRVCFTCLKVQWNLKPPVSPGLRCTPLKMGPTTMRDVRVLAAIAALPQIESIQWTVFVDPSALQDEINLAARQAMQNDHPPPELPVVPKIDTLALHVLHANEAPFCLSMFPDVMRLVVAHYIGQGGIFTAWPASLQKNLKELAILRSEPSSDANRRAQSSVAQAAPAAAAAAATNAASIRRAEHVAWQQRRFAGETGMQDILGGAVKVEAQKGLNGTMVDSLTAAGLSAVTRLNLVGSPGEPVDLELLCKTMPNIVDLTLKRITPRHPNLYFRHLTKLVSLKELIWTWPADPWQSTSLAVHFPSLTYLHVAEADDRQPVPWATALATIPHLHAVRWRREKKLQPAEIVGHFVEMDAARRRIQKERAATDAEEAKAMVARAKLAADARNYASSSSKDPAQVPAVARSDYKMSAGGTAFTPASTGASAQLAEAALASAQAEWQVAHLKRTQDKLAALEAGHALFPTGRVHPECQLTGSLRLVRQFCSVPRGSKLIEFFCQLVCVVDERFDDGGDGVRSFCTDPSQCDDGPAPSGHFFLFLFGSKMHLVDDTLSQCASSVWSTMKDVGRNYYEAIRYFDWFFQKSIEWPYDEYLSALKATIPLDQWTARLTVSPIEVRALSEQFGEAKAERDRADMLAMLVELKASFEEDGGASEDHPMTASTIMDESAASQSVDGHSMISEESPLGLQNNAPPQQQPPQPQSQVSPTDPNGSTLAASSIAGSAAVASSPSTLAVGPLSPSSTSNPFAAAIASLAVASATEAPTPHTTGARAGDACAPKRPLRMRNRDQ